MNRLSSYMRAGKGSTLMPCHSSNRTHNAILLIEGGSSTFCFDVYQYTVVGVIAYSLIIKFHNPYLAAEVTL